MKWRTAFLCVGSFATLVAVALAQAPAVPVTAEQHHHLVLQNSYVRAYKVEVAAHDATLLHQHDIDYLYVVLGDADIINAVRGKPEARVKLKDAEVRFSRGGFAHIAKNPTDRAFRNITVELLRPQGEAKNQCAEVVPGPRGKCEVRKGAAERGPRAGYIVQPQFETDEVRLLYLRLEPGARYKLSDPQLSRLLITLDSTEIEARAGGKARQFPADEVAWLEGTSQETLTNRGKTLARLYVLEFKDSAAATALR